MRIAIVGSYWNPSAASFFIYGSAFIANGFRTRTAAMVLVVQVLIGGVASFALGMEWWFYMASVVISALIGAITIQARAKEAGDARLRMAQEEIERLAKLAERERIARDLHDLLGHTLSVVVLKSELAQKLMSRDPARALQEMAEVERISRQGLAEVREADHRLSIVGPRRRDRARARNADRRRHRHDHRSARRALAPAQETALSLALARGGDQRDSPRRGDEVPHQVLRAGRLGADGSAGRWPRRRCAVRQRPERHARADPGARRRAAARNRATARAC